MWYNLLGFLRDNVCVQPCTVLDQMLFEDDH